MVISKEELDVLAQAADADKYSILPSISVPTYGISWPEQELEANTPDDARKIAAAYLRDEEEYLVPADIRNSIQGLLEDASVKTYFKSETEQIMTAVGQNPLKKNEAIEDLLLKMKNTIQSNKGEQDLDQKVKISKDIANIKTSVLNEVASRNTISHSRDEI